MSDVGPAFVGNRFMGASWRPGADAGVLGRLREAIRGWAMVEGPGWLLASERADAWGEIPGVAVALGRRAAFDRKTAAFHPPGEVAWRLASHGETAFSDMAPPFRAAWAQRAEELVHGETDAFGLGQVFVGRGDGAAFLSSSATLLADILGAPLSAERLAGYALFGGFIAEETPFAVVDKLMAGTRVTLSRGRLEIAQRTAGSRSGADLTAAFRGAVDAMLRAAPEAELELSGGLDSRLILAAMSGEARRGRRAITIGVAGEPSDDVTVARELAAGQGLDWTLLDAGGVGRLDGPTLSGLLRDTAIAYDHLANPLDKVTLVLAARGRTVEARFGGQNGEILRGFYYPAQPLRASPSEALARSLIAMRLQANDQVESAVLAAGVRAELRAAAETRMARLLLSFGGTWGQTLDQFYLAQRMQNWVGSSTGHRLMDHAPLYPFFDPDFVAAAMATPSAEKLNSRVACGLLDDLDPDLARMPLAGGVVPARAASAGHLSDFWLDAQRVTGRLARRLKGRTRPTLGSQTVAQHWRRLGLHAELPVDRLARTGLFDVAALDAIASGSRLPSRPTLGFLLMMASLETRR